jgi:hypothetical protein
MTNDPTTLLSQRRAMELSAKTVALLTSKGEDVLIAVLVKARTRAEAAMVGLTAVNPEDAAGIRRLQNEVVLFTDLLDHLRSVVMDGIEAEEELSNTVRAEAADFAISEEDRIALGLNEGQAPQ